MRDEIQIVGELEQWAGVLVRNASVESAHLRKAQECLIEVVTGMSVLADKAANVAAGFHNRLATVESDLRPSSQMIARMTGVLKRIKELLDTVENTVQSQAAATENLARTVGEAVGGGARITNQIVALAEAIKTALPMAGNRSKEEAELATLAAEVHDFVAHLHDHRGSMDGVVPDAPTSGPFGKPPALS